MSLQWLLLHPPPGKPDSNESGRRGGWSNRRLKILGLVLLTAGQFSRSLLYPGFAGKAPSDISLLPLTVALALEVTSWVAIPIYAWLLVQGFRHTRSIPRYLARLVVFAALAEVPYDLGTAWKPFDFGSQNPVFGLVVALLVLWALRRLEGRPGFALVTLRALIVLAGGVYMMVLHIDQHQRIIFGGLIMLGFTLIFNYLDRSENTMILAGTFWGILGAMFPSLGLLAIHGRSEELGYAKPSTRWLFYGLYLVMLVAFALPHV